MLKSNTNTTNGAKNSENGPNNILEQINAVPRDACIDFVEYGHKYIIKTDKKSKYTSVTTWCHSHFPKFDADEVITNMMNGKNWNPENKYWGISPSQIKADWNKNGASAAKAGTAMHYNIECFMNGLFGSMATIGKMPAFDQTHAILLANYEENINKRLDDSFEWSQFIEFVKAYPHLKPYRTEWKIYDEELKLAGSIDMVYENDDGTLEIYDWKRCKEIVKTNGFGRSAITECINYIPDANFWHYALQLNTYKAILEKNYGKIVTGLYLVRLHPDNNENNYEVLKVPVLAEDMATLFAERSERL